jgi:glycerol kinase
MLFNLHTQAWDASLLKQFNIPFSILPQVVPSSGVLAETDSHLLGVSVPIAGVAGDQQAATFGQACFAPGMAKNTYGTGCFMLMNTGHVPVQSRNQLLTTVAWQGPQALCKGLAFNRLCLRGLCVHGRCHGAMAARWFANHSKSQRRRSVGSQRAQHGRCLLGARICRFGRTRLGRPSAWHFGGHDPRHHKSAHIARAALEAIAWQVADVFLAMSKDSGLALTELRVDGGASQNNLLMQMQADALGVPVVRSSVTETTALGASYLAGLATGFWSGADEITAQWSIDRKFVPQATASAIQARQSGHVRWREAVSPFAFLGPRLKIL